MNNNNLLSGAIGVGANVLMSATSGEFIRNEVTAWVTLIGSLAVTITTIALQIYCAIRDRDKNKDKDKDKDSDENSEE